MTAHRSAKGLAAGLLAMLLWVSTAAAHHGWSWAEDQQTELRGTIREIYIGYPHPTLRVETPNDGIWIVELAPPNQSAKAGFTETSAKAGDQLIAIGNRSLTKGEHRMKAVRIIVNNRTYDVYPDRIRS